MSRVVHRVQFSFTADVLAMKGVFWRRVEKIAHHMAKKLQGMNMIGVKFRSFEITSDMYDKGYDFKEKRK